MKTLQPPDTHYLSSALGWLLLGNRREAEAEFARVSAPARRHPDALEVEWSLHAHAQRWEPALETANTLLEVAPDRASGWLHRAYALRRLPHGGLQTAYEALLPAAEQFPAEPTVAFNLACYTCQLGRLDEARQWLRRACQAADTDPIRRMALEDEDLKALWPEIREWQ